MQPRFLTLPDPSDPARSRKLAYYEWGSEHPETILCVHGLSRNGRDFDALASALSNRYRVICPDMAGRGQSDWLSVRGDYTYSTYATDTEALLAAVAAPRVHWIGTSMGGIIGMMMAARYPERIRSLVLNDIGSIVSAEGLRRITGYVGQLAPFKDENAAMTALRPLLAPFGIETEEQWQTMFLASFLHRPDGSVVFAYDPGIADAFRQAATGEDGQIIDIDLTKLWESVQCPALILRGANSDILSSGTAHVMCNRVSPTRLIEWPGVGHAPALLSAPQIAAVREWVESQP